MDVRACYDQSHSEEHMRGQRKASIGHVAACGVGQELAPAQSQRFTTFLPEKNIYFVAMREAHSISYDLNEIK